MNTYWVLVRLKDEPGAAVAKQFINASNPFEAISMARAMYGRLLLTECASPC